MPKHKGTDRLHGELRKKLARFREEAKRRPAGSKKGYIYHVEKVGAGQIALVGPPNSGKSKLLETLTNANPEIADYPFTTRMPIPGMMRYENVQIQLVDLPPIAKDLTEPWVFGIIRNADAIFLVFDLSDHDILDRWEMVFSELEGARIKPFGKIMEEVEEKAYLLKRAIVIGNKLDIPGARENSTIFNDLYGDSFDIINVSAFSGENTDTIVKMGFEILDIVRAYTKAPGKAPDLDDPVILKRGATLLDFAEKIHKDFRDKLKFARIWGKEKHDGQKVQRDYVIMDGDIIELHI
jgi:ribosome-interacting GTPase 1